MGGTAWGPGAAARCSGSRRSIRWRLLIVIVSVVLAGVAAGVFTWFGTAAQHSGVGFGKLVEAGLNSAVPAAFIIGLGILMLGLRPRLTSAVLYAVIGWSFLMEMIGPAIHLNHWVLDTSLLHHVVLAPAAASRWSTAGILAGVGLIAAVIGAILFNRRDLAGK